MRGRWRWVLLGAAAAGPLAALAGWLSAQPTWQATGTVVFALRDAAAPGAAEPHDPLPVAPLTPPIGDAPWRAARLDEVLQRELDLLRQVGGKRSTVRRTPNTGTRLELTVRTDQRDRAHTLLAGALAAYRAQTPLVPEALRADQLDARAQELTQRWTELAQRRSAITAGQSQPSAPGAADPGDAELRWQTAAATTDTAQRRARIATAHAQVLLNTAPPRLAELAAVDPETKRILAQRDALNTALASISSPPSPRTAEQTDQRDALDARLQTRQTDTRLLPAPTPPGATAAGPPPMPRVVSVSAAVSQAQALEAAAAQAARRMTALEPRLTEQRRRATALAADTQALRVDTAELARQHAALGPGGGTIRLAPTLPPPPPASIDHDPRPRYALLGGLGGLALGALLPLAWFLSDRRIRRTRQGELVGTDTPLLGTVPVMDGGASTGHGPVESIDAVRAVLEAHTESGDQTFAVTGVAHGSGASSMAVGLAVSMALAGQRVLLIDLSWLQAPADPDGPTAQAGRGVDGVIAELGYLNDEDQERLALATHDTAPNNNDNGDAAAHGGFTALLSGASLTQSIVRTRLPRLSVLSALGRGHALRGRWTGRLSSKWLRELTKAGARERDVLIIDAGTADGGIEGSLACAAADGALIVVGSDETQSDFVRCAGRLKLVGAQVIGTVLNRHGQRRLGGDHTNQRRVAAGGVRGSGLFAAAIEARRGDDARQPPLPHTAPNNGDTHRSVDPIPEPPANVRLTPCRP